MKDNILISLVFAAFIGAGVVGTVWATKHGSPQHVWFFCDVLKWCK